MTSSATTAQETVVETIEVVIVPEIGQYFRNGTVSKSAIINHMFWNWFKNSFEATGSTVRVIVQRRASI